MWVRSKLASFLSFHQGLKGILCICPELFSASIWINYCYTVAGQAFATNCGLRSISAYPLFVCVSTLWLHIHFMNSYRLFDWLSAFWPGSAFRVRIRFFEISHKPCLGSRGVLPYITYMGMCRPTGSWFWSSWLRTGYTFQKRLISNAWKLQFCKQPFEIIQGHIAFKNTVQFTNFVERRLKNWPISRTGYQF